MARARWHIDQSAALAYRWSRGSPQVLLVTSRNTRRWVLPKGGIKSGLAASTSAAQEAYEEAGIGGRVSPACIGVYSYMKKNGKGDGVCIVRVFPLQVMTIHADWPERGQRRREWVSLPVASTRVKERALKRMLLSFAARLARGGRRPGVASTWLPPAGRCPSR